MIIVAAVAATAIILVGIFFLQFRSAVLMSVLTTLAGGVGAVGFLFVAALFLPSKTIESGVLVLAYLGGAMLAGLMSGGFVAWKYWRIAKRRNRR